MNDKEFDAFVIDEEFKARNYYSSKIWCNPLLKSPTKSINNRANDRVRTLVNQHILPVVTTQNCVDCNSRANHYHHWKSYEMCDWDKVVPMCVSCHRALHAKIRKDYYYMYGSVYSYTYYIELIHDITTRMLDRLHGTESSRVAKGVVQSLGIVLPSTVVRVTQQMLPDNICDEYSQGASTTTLATKYGCSNETVRQKLLKLGVRPRLHGWRY